MDVGSWIGEFRPALQEGTHEPQVLQVQRLQEHRTQRLLFSAAYSFVNTQFLQDPEQYDTRMMANIIGT